MEKVFVTGADGMLGSSITRELLKQGYAVKAMCLPGRETGTLNGLPIEKVFGDVLNKDFLKSEMKGCSFVIHVAAMTNVWPRRIKKVRDVNFSGTQNVMEVAEELQLKRMIHIGTASSFTHGPKDNPGDENTSFTSGKYGMDYIDSKYEAQQMLLKRYKEAEFPVIIVNPTFMIGPFDSGPSSGQMLIGLSNGAVPGYSGGGKNFVCSVDVATAAVNALIHGRLGQCYIAGGENLSYKEFFMKACLVMGKPFKLRAVPNFLILVVGAVNSLIARITGKPPKLSYGMATMASVDQYFSSQKAKQELNMPSTPIEEGIKQCLSWFKENGYLK